MIEEVVKVLLTVVGGIVAVALLRAGANRPARYDTTTGDLILQCPDMIVWLTGVIVVAGVFFVDVTFFVPIGKQQLVYVLLTLGGIFIVSGWLSYMQIIRWRTMVGEQGVTSETWFGGQQFLPWDQVERLDFSKLVVDAHTGAVAGGELSIHGPANFVVRVPIWFRGIREAVPLLQKYLPATVQANDREAIDQFAAIAYANTPKTMNTQPSGTSSRKPRRIFDEDLSIDQTWDRIEAWLWANAPKVAEELKPPATPAVIAETERFLGVRFPDDVRASYLRHNGQEPDSPGLLECWEWLSLERIRDEWKVWKDLLDDGDFDGISSDADGKEVRKNWWHPAWIPLTYDGAGDHHCLDLAPGPQGTTGQIIEMWHDEGSRPVIAASFGEWLADFADQLEAGEFVMSEEHHGLCRRDDV